MLKVSNKPEVFVYDLELNDVPINEDEYDEWTQYHELNNRIKEENKYQARISKTEQREMLGQFKVPYVSYLLNKIWDKRYIVFCPSIRVARDLYDLHPIDSCCVDTTSSLEVNKENLTLFNNGDRNHLFIVGGLNECTKLKEVDAGVIMQLDKGEKTLIQKFSNKLDSECPKMYFFRFKDTVDEELVEDIAWKIDSKQLTNWGFSRKLLEKK